jgi:UrcA family protein
MNISKQKYYRNFLAIGCAAVTMGLAAAANAGDVLGPDVAVHYGDLAIASEQGATKLLRRIERAAQRVCAPLNDGTLASRANAKDCRRELTAAAVSKVNHPMVQAAYDSSKGLRSPMASLRR